MTLIDIEKNYPYTAPIVELATSFLHELRIKIFEYKINPDTVDYEYSDHFFNYINNYEERIMSENTLNRIEKSRIAKIDGIQDRLTLIIEFVEKLWERYNKDIHHFCNTTKNYMENLYNYIWED